MAEEKLIEAVKMHKDLYDPNQPNYANAIHRKLIWNKIAKTLNMRSGEYFVTYLDTLEIILFNALVKFITRKFWPDI